MRFRWLIVGVSLVVFGLLGWAASQAEFSYRHPRKKSVKIVVTNGGAFVASQPAAVAVTALKPSAPQTSPRAIANERIYDFGKMDPLAKGSHQFTISNTGDAPLTLNVLSTTCKCTVAGIENGSILPGGSGRVELNWTTPPEGPLFSQAATIQTNDPASKTLQFTVKGSVQTLLGANVEEVVLLKDPDRAAAAEVTLYSQRWTNFRVVSLDSKIAGLAWKEADAPSAAAESLDATCARQLQLTIPTDLEEDRADDVLRIAVEAVSVDGAPLPSEQLTALNIEIPLHVTTKRRLSIYGPTIRSTGFIEIGEASQGTAKQVKLQVKIRDREPNLPGLEMELTPSFLRAELTPHVEQSTGAAVTGLYDLIVTIPADAPVCTHLGDVMGQLRIKTSHPRIPETALGLRFAVLPK